MTDGLQKLAELDFHDLSGSEAIQVLDALETVARRAAGIRAAVLPVIEQDGLWATSGAATLAAWLRNRTLVSNGVAHQQVRDARALRDHLPATRAALHDAHITAEHVTALARWTSRTEKTRAALLDERVGEDFLLTQAKIYDASAFNRIVRHWAEAADPEAADRAWRDEGAKEELSIASTTGGHHVHGWLDDANGDVVDVALRAFAPPRTKDDERTAAQRRAAALVAIARMALDSGTAQRGARIRPHLNVTVPFETLNALVAASAPAVPAAFGGQAADDGACLGVVPLLPVDGTDADVWARQWRPGDDHTISTAIDYDALTGLPPATLEDNTPIAPGLLARLACESQLARVIFGAESTILDAGREKRIFPAHQARAIIARDRHCQYPGCTSLPAHGEIHHSLWWYKHGGETKVDQGILLCWQHHDIVHAREITIHRRSGAWLFTDRNGQLITAPTMDFPALQDRDPAGAMAGATGPPDPVPRM
ncbi:HNH endonuclease signature motif containing protein [Georgenia sp. MJ206]|uniref:HNH endonuclease signature motif containing protein n=1 Tax=Georgenia wangjunii TaxID=3117730 RepID=UPI002F26D390